MAPLHHLRWRSSMSSQLQALLRVGDNVSEQEQ
ncbi:hypothetical protein L195_g062389, partial [Trifolium pratense]